MSQRSSQVAEELRKIISVILLREISDPRMGFLTVTRIELTDDLRYARIFYSVLGNEEQKQSTQEALAEHLGLIRRMAVERINMKYAMEIKFELDPSIEHSFNIDNILRKIKNKNDQ
ncbi:MAG: 30S ribosome-binding factor RbfA [Candidatus Omnitrophica bacterium]|nr:30S ribosome-binding factor RbfA [Candidatus Omnitrophota bacterium]